MNKQFLCINILSCQCWSASLAITLFVSVCLKQLAVVALWNYEKHKTLRGGDRRPARLDAVGPIRVQHLPFTCLLADIYLHTLLPLSYVFWINVHLPFLFFPLSPILLKGTYIFYLMAACFFPSVRIKKAAVVWLPTLFFKRSLTVRQETSSEFY